MSETIKQRNVATDIPNEKEDAVAPALEEDIDDIKKKMKVNSSNPQLSVKHKIASTTVAVMAFFTTFYKIWFPAQVVFDEVHFGKFAGYYLQRTFFFDVHPPLAKLMLAAVGYLIGFDGVYNFGEIGQSYAKHQVPYIVLRSLPATLNIASVCLVYSILKESGFSVLTCAMTSTLYLLDNAFIAQNRLIMLDSILIFYVLCSVYSYVRFRKLRHSPFTKSWYTWMCLTGLSMALTLSVKMIGLFIFAAIGIAVLMDLWDIVDMKSGFRPIEIAHHFAARAVALGVLPICVYLFWFYVHFSILNTSGPGDEFMSYYFRKTLKDSPLREQSLDIMYNQSIRLQHRDTSAFLHSHELNYPAQYEDGRYSARGQQVVGNKQPDLGSYWRILPAMPEPGVDMNTQYVRNNDVIQLEHIATGSLLLTHDVASPWTRTNQEVTTTKDESKLENTFFRVVINDGDPSSFEEPWSTLTKSVFLIHAKTNVGLKVHPKELPDWGNFHYEVNGEKNAMLATNLWVATDILGVDPLVANKDKPKPVVAKMPFLFKFIELQIKMIEHNNRLTVTHPYQSKPQSWPLMSRGISYWTEFDTQRQIYLTGNVVGWWTGALSILLFCVVNFLDLLLQKRGIKLFRPTTRIRVNRTGGFFLLLWSAHYFPFFLMGRSLYLHHYLPAMACNYLLLGSVFEYFFIEGVNSPVSQLPPNTKHSFDRARSTWKSYLAATVLVSAQFMVYRFLAPFTYGDTTLSQEEVSQRKVFQSWDLQFALPPAY